MKREIITVLFQLQVLQ